MLKQILWSNDHDFMKIAELIKFGFNNTLFAVTNKALNMAMFVPLLINFYKLRCPVIHSHS